MYLNTVLSSVWILWVITLRVIMNKVVIAVASMRCEETNRNMLDAVKP